MLNIVTGYKFSFGFREIEGSAVSLSDDGDQANRQEWW